MRIKDLIKDDGIDDVTIHIKYKDKEVEEIHEVSKIPFHLRGNILYVGVGAQIC